MFNDKAKIEAILKQKLDPVFLNVIDDSAKHAGHAGAREGGHYHVRIVSPAFEGKKLLERHRMVYEVLMPLKGLIHALAMETKAPTEMSHS
jgi:BolA protein